MKPLAVTLLIVAVYLAFPARLTSAQCNDYAGCAGQRADANAKLGQWARETAVAIAEERRAAATERAYERMIALTATEAARPTKTPVPTVTAWPTATSLPTATPQPVATVTSVPIVTTEAKIVETAPRVNTSGIWFYFLVFGFGVSAVMAAAAFGFLWNWHSKKQTHER